jgi:DUF1365 family protein
VTVLNLPPVDAPSTVVVDAVAPAARRPAVDVRAGGEVALFEGTLRHRRFEPVSHSFTAEVFFAFLDVDALPGSLDRLPLWSARRAAPLRFRREDYLDGTDRPLGDALRDLVEIRTGRRPGGPVHLLTQVRTAGWVFNPLSIYFCFSPSGAALEALVLEVTNTPWKERCWYVVEVTADGPNDPWEFPKAMHVSPFLDMDLTYRLRCTGPGESLVVHLEDRKGDRTVFEADLALRRIEVDRRRALTVPLRHPLLTWRVTAAVHLHALRLWAKRVPVVPHVTRPVDNGPSASEGETPA